ncbi:hypothetical protein [Lacibacter sp.]|uniref:hypothetical protein n=1 Tax=Lacibacter sp. TaxID=1915409 RepID=UPI002B4AAF97|nr:hypothetical protein [Lacibacter sp.]HLP36954.1 hypothetical protein [Lacibacter sp.]
MRWIVFVFLLTLASCTNSSYSSSDESETTSEPEDEYSDGTWCADVEYYNPNTGTRNTYSLDVEVENGELTQINWPNGGWLDESHFTAEDISEGECSFTSDKGYEYTVTLTTKGGGCGSSDGFRMQDDIERDVRAVTCPVCGEEKYSYEDECDECQQKKETCPKCYGFKMEWDRICDNCKEEEEAAEKGEEDF